MKILFLVELCLTHMSRLWAFARKRALKTLKPSFFVSGVVNSCRVPQKETRNRWSRSLSALLCGFMYRWNFQPVGTLEG